VLTIIGEALVDLVDAGDHTTFRAHPGGSPFNVAIGLARLGQPTALMARFSDDPFGQLLRLQATANGVDLSASASAAESSTLAVVSLDDDGQPNYNFWVDATADWQWNEAELAQLPAGTKVLHTGSLASWTGPGDARIARLVKSVRERTTTLISYDPNVRPRLLGTAPTGRVRIEANVGAAHVVKASMEDIDWLYPGRSAVDVARGWLALGAELVVITDGAAGASAFRREHKPLHRAGLPVTVADTVGAGDAFMAGLLAALFDAGVRSPEALTSLQNEQSLAEVLDQAILVAALTCERVGANPPTKAELDAAQRRLGRLH
jgi:fructokinase